MDKDKIETAFREALHAKVFSGAQVVFGRGPRRLYSGTFGSLSFEDDTALVSEYSLFDIASLTKPVATTALCMLARREAKLDLDARVGDILPEFRRSEPISVRHLLQHNSGLPAWLPLYEEVRGKGWGYEDTKSFFTSHIAQTPLQAGVGERRIYSDLGFILLGFLLEKIFRRRLEGLFWERVAMPLEMTHTMFHPTHHPERAVPRDIVATEVCPWRGRLLWGEVHDDNAHVLGGAAGHAGLFGNALDLEKLVREILAARRGQGRWLDAATFAEFLGDGISPKLGWDGVNPSRSQAGTGFGAASSIGHLAFTGCSLWIDFSDEKYAILLTNRVHPSRDNEAIKGFRPKIHDLLVRSFPSSP